MYCIRCGKQNDNGESICNECLLKMNGQTSAPIEKTLAEQAAKVEPEVKAEQAESQSSGGFASGLVALILSVVGFVFAMYSVSIAIIPEGYSVAVVLVALSLPGAIVAIRHGVRAVCSYKQMKELSLGKAITTLVFGIVGISVGATSLFICTYSFIFAMAV